MNIFEIILTGISLAMDAFTISIIKGLSNSNIKNGLVIALYFGIFQFIMPILGFYLGNILSERIIKYNPYISMILLITIGILMIKEKNDEELDCNINFKEMILLSIATSIDAFVIAISFSFLKINISLSSTIIGIITFILCFMGYFLGNMFNKKIKKHSNLIGGIILILLGIKILLKYII